MRLDQARDLPCHNVGEFIRKIPALIALHGPIWTKLEADDRL